MSRMLFLNAMHFCSNRFRFWLIDVSRLSESDDGDNFMIEHFTNNMQIFHNLSAFFLIALLEFRVLTKNFE